MNFFDKKLISQDDRFKRAVILGIIVSIVLGIVSGYLRLAIGYNFGFNFSIVIIGFGYLMGMFIQKVGRGVQTRFSNLAAGLAVLMIIISNFIAYGFSINLIFNLNAHMFIIRSMLVDGLNTIIMLFGQFLAVATAYRYARVI